MRYVQYYEYDEKENRFFQACGDRSVVILDARNSIENSMNDAFEFNGKRRPKYNAFKLYQGKSLMRSHPITGLMKLIPERKPKNDR